MKTLVAATALLMLFASAAATQAQPIAACLTEASRVYPMLTIDQLRQYMAEHPECKGAEPANTLPQQATKELNPVEKCANLQLIVDRSLSVTQAFDICKTRNPFETWLAVRESNREKDPTYRAVRDGVRDALRR